MGKDYSAAVRNQFLAGMNTVGSERQVVDNVIEVERAILATVLDQLLGTAAHFVLGDGWGMDSAPIFDPE